MSGRIHKGNSAQRFGFSATFLAHRCDCICVGFWTLRAFLESDVSISESDRNAALHFFTVLICPYARKSRHQGRLAMVDVSYHPYIYASFQVSYLRATRGQILVDALILLIFCMLVISCFVRYFRMRSF